MRYQGGKGRIARHLAPVVLDLAGGQSIVEPFCGSLAMTRILHPILASDGCPALINLITAVRQGWDPPDAVTEDEYQNALRRRSEVEDPMICFIGFLSSWGAKWFGGYARDNRPGRRGVAAERESLLKRVRDTLHIPIARADYREVTPGPVVYCDPPYLGTTCDYPGVEPFDHNEFWQTARCWAASGSTVLVSEFRAPEGVECVWSMGCSQQTRSRDPWKMERLFRL